MGLFDPVDEEEIILENANLDCEPQGEFVSKRWIKKLDEYLEPGESVHFFALDESEGLKIDGERQSGGVMTMIMTTVTDRRVLFKRNKPIGGSQTSINFSDISSVEVKFGVMSKRLNLETDSTIFGIGVGKLAKDEVQNMAQFIREKMREANQDNNSSTHNEVTASSEGEENSLDKLERLGELRDDGVITEEEFQNKKESLLDQI